MINTDILIGIDAGTSVIKSVAFDLTGQQIADTARKNQYVSTIDGGVEQDMEQTWLNTLATLKELVEQIPNAKSRIQGLAITGQGSGNWLIDSKGEPVAPASLWLDARASSLVSKFRQSSKEARRFEICGTGLASCDQAPQWLWLKQSQPDRLKQATTAFHCKDWLYFKMTDQRATDPSEAVFSFGDYKTGQYSEEVIELLGLQEEKRLLPPIVNGIHTSAPLQQEVAHALGIPSGVPVVLGYVDVVCSLLGSGLYDESGDIGCSIIGSTGMHAVLKSSIEQVQLNQEKTGYTMLLPIPHHFAQAQSNLSGTINFDWIGNAMMPLLKTLGIKLTPSQLHQGLDQKIMEAAAGEILFFPYISEAGERGPFIEPSARAGFIGLNIRHNYYDMIRSIFEGLCLATKDCYQIIGKPPAEIRLIGGAAKSQALRSLLAAMLHIPIRAVNRKEAGATGAAMIAAVSLGIYPNLQDCVKKWIMPCLGKLEQPDPALTQIYQKLYPIYKESRQHQVSTWRALQNLKINKLTY